MTLDELDVPIVLAPLAGGPSTPELAAAVSNAGGLGFLGAGYLSSGALRERLAAARRVAGSRIAVNLFANNGSPADAETYTTYVESLRPEAERLGVEVGRPKFDDDEFDAKVDVLIENPVPVVSFTFGLPREDAVARLRGAGSQIWITVTSPYE